MNTTDNTHLNIAEKYYHEMLQKNFDAMGKCLHTDVCIVSPLAELAGKDAVIQAAKNLTQILEDIKIRAKFASENRIMFAYDFMFRKPIGKLRAAVLMEFTNQLISKIELFYDGRVVEEKKDDIFSTQKN